MWDKVNVEFSGKLTIVGLGSTKMVKEANCVLSNTNNQFSFTISERSFLSSREIKETVSLENVVCESSLSSGGSRIFVLKNRNDEAVLKNYMTVEMSATTENADYWVRAFTSFGIFKDTNENILVANMLAKVEDTPVRKVSVPKTKLENFPKATETESINHNICNSVKNEKHKLTNIGKNKTPENWQLQAVREHSRLDMLNNTRLSKRNRLKQQAKTSRTR